jgi:hypothetical protein
MLAKLATLEAPRHHPGSGPRVERSADPGIPVRAARGLRGAQGEVNAWDNEDFVGAVQATGQEDLVAGVWTTCA